jgi:hypothetical protein
MSVYDEVGGSMSVYDEVGGSMSVYDEVGVSMSLTPAVSKRFWLPNSCWNHDTGQAASEVGLPGS